MAEIKSTLDLIMEKTKGLSMTPREKEALRQEEWLKKARGLIQKFLDGWMDLDKVKEEILLKETPPEWEGLIKKEVLAGLAPETDNGKRLELLRDLLQIPAEPYLKVFEDFNRRMEQEKQRQETLLRQGLAAQGISGSAVQPNLETAPSWKEHYDREWQSCKKALTAL
ncbi:MAG: hypothetical protein AB1585_21130 [Thermodesulfobacteriota bacterium]